MWETLILRIMNRSIRSFFLTNLLVEYISDSAEHIAVIFCCLYAQCSGILNITINTYTEQALNSYSYTLGINGFGID